MSIETYQKEADCRCPKHDKLLGRAEVGSKVFLWCKKCNKEITFTITNEPDCLRVTAFIENEKINEKTVSNPTIRNVA